MSVTSFATGSQTCTVTTEHQLADTNVAGVFVLHLDTVNLADGDVLEARVYQMVLTAGTARVLLATAWYGAQPTDDKIKVSIPAVNDLTDSTSLRFSITQTFGSSRVVPWKVVKIG